MGKKKRRAVPTSVASHFLLLTSLKDQSYSWTGSSTLAGDHSESLGQKR